MPNSCPSGSTPSLTKSFVLMRLLNLAFPFPFSAGKVSSQECHSLASMINKIGGGNSVLPSSCNAILKFEEDEEADRFERENAKVYERLKRRNTFVGKADWPPTAC